MRAEKKREGGFTLIEVMLSTCVLATVFVVVGNAMVSSVQRTVEMKQRNIVVTQSWKFAERLQRIPYGAGDADATAAQYDNLFDDDGNLGDVSLRSIRTEVGEEGMRFRLIGFEVDGDWEVQVNEDLNGDGDTSDVNEDTGGLMRIEVFFNGRSVLKTYRAQPAEST